MTSWPARPQSAADLSPRDGQSATRCRPRVAPGSLAGVWRPAASTGATGGGKGRVMAGNNDRFQNRKIRGGTLGDALDDEGRTPSPDDWVDTAPVRDIGQDTRSEKGSRTSRHEMKHAAAAPRPAHRVPVELMSDTERVRNGLPPRVPACEPQPRPVAHALLPSDTCPEDSPPLPSRRRAELGLPDSQTVVGRGAAPAEERSRPHGRCPGRSSSGSRCVNFAGRSVEGSTGDRTSPRSEAVPAGERSPAPENASRSAETCTAAEGCLEATRPESRWAPPPAGGVVPQLRAAHQRARPLRLLLAPRLG